MHGSLEPNSRINRLSPGAAAAMMCCPAVFEPVNAIMSTSPATSALPWSSSPWITCSTPSGRNSLSTLTYSSAISGVCSLGLSTTVLPATSAGITAQCGIRIGKFHGVIAAHTPNGS